LNDSQFSNNIVWIKLMTCIELIKLCCQRNSQHKF